MKFNFNNLDEQTREFMISEIKSDIDNERLYLSKRFNEKGIELYPNLLIDAVSSGDEETLAIALNDNDCFLDKEPRNGKNGITYAKVPVTASITLAESEFNRFYIRGLALKSQENKQRLRVYRARFSDNPRAESEMIIGNEVDADILLNDLRSNIGVDTALGLPSGPNSGLSVELV